MDWMSFWEGNMDWMSFWLGVASMCVVNIVVMVQSVRR